MPIAELGKEKVFPLGGKNYKYNELGKEKVFPLGGKNYKYKKLNREKVSALPTKEGCKKTKNKCG